MRAALLLLLAIAPGLHAQDREDFPPTCPDETLEAPCPGQFLLPRSLERDRAYPVVVLLPYTFGSAELLWRQYDYGQEDPAVDRLRTEVIFILIAGDGSPYDYATAADWSATIQRYEARARHDLARLAATHRIDSTGVVFAGFSMGGDLAWALTLRDPAHIRGAVVMGSRASYRIRAAEQSAFVQQAPRIFFTMGAVEDSTRLAGARAADRYLTGLDVTHEFREFPGGFHQPPPFVLFAEGVRYALGHQP